MKVLAQDYNLPPVAIRPAADSKYLSDAQRISQAAAVLQAAHTTPGYNVYEVNKQYLKALGVDSIESVLPNPKGPNAIQPPTPPKVQIEQMKLQAKQMEMQQTMRLKMFEMMEEHALNQAKILKLEADAAKSLAEAGGVQEGHDIAKFEAILGAEKAKQEGRASNIKMMQEMIQSLHSMEMDHKDQSQEDTQIQQVGQQLSQQPKGAQ